MYRGSMRNGTKVYVDTIEYQFTTDPILGGHLHDYVNYVKRTTDMITINTAAKMNVIKNYFYA